MLQLRTVEPRTLELLGQLMKIPELGSFVLAGGTAVSLDYGHRLSIDLDLFSTTDFDSTQLEIVFEKQFPGFRYGSLQNPVAFSDISTTLKQTSLDTISIRLSKSRLSKVIFG